MGSGFNTFLRRGGSRNDSNRRFQYILRRGGPKMQQYPRLKPHLPAFSSTIDCKIARMSTVWLRALPTCMRFRGVFTRAVPHCPDDAARPMRSLAVLRRRSLDSCTVESHTLYRNVILPRECCTALCDPSVFYLARRELSLALDAVRPEQLFAVVRLLDRRRPAVPVAHQVLQRLGQRGGGAGGAAEAAAAAAAAAAAGRSGASPTCSVLIRSRSLPRLSAFSTCAAAQGPSTTPSPVSAFGKDKGRRADGGALGAPPYVCRMRFLGLWRTAPIFFTAVCDSSVFLLQGRTVSVSTCCTRCCVSRWMTPRMMAATTCATAHNHTDSSEDDDRREAAAAGGGWWRLCAQQCSRALGALTPLGVSPNRVTPFVATP
eukprot:SAG11_NODE_3197_length_2616_cov_1.649186_2_plen_374_part_00